MSDDDRDLVAKLRDWADIYAYAIVSDELLEAAGEIERLRRWKADAITLLNGWCDLAEEVYEAMGKPPASLGRPRPTRLDGGGGPVSGRCLFPDRELYGCTDCGSYNHTAGAIWCPQDPPTPTGDRDKWDWNAQ